MLNIELPWIDGDRLKRRWYSSPYIHAEDLVCEELHHCIFELELPVYNFDRELQEGIELSISDCKSRIEVLRP